MVGDSLEADIVGAVNAGMKAIYLCPEKTVDAQHEDYLIVRELLEIKNILK